jgi:hypothetical protein
VVLGSATCSPMVYGSIQSVDVVERGKIPILMDAKKLLGVSLIATTEWQTPSMRVSDSSTWSRAMWGEN